VSAELGATIVMGLGVFCAALFQGLLGFGFGLLSIPVISCYIDIKQAIFMGVLLTFVHYVVIGIRNLMILQFRNVLLMFGGCVVGIGVGMLIYIYIDEFLLKLLTGLMVSLSGFLLVGGRFPKIRMTKVRGFFVGIVGGLLQTMTGMGGPAFIIYFSSASLEVQEFRSIVISLFLMMSGMSCLMLSLSGKVHFSIGLLLMLLPGLLIGHEVGTRLISIVSEKIFRTIAHSLIVLSGFAMIFKAYY